MEDHKECPACERNQMHLCKEPHKTLREVDGGRFWEESVSDALHWHCDKCGHRVSLTEEESAQVPADAYIYQPHKPGHTKAGKVK